MTWPEPTLSALKLANGAAFHRCALQVNPSGYSALYRGKNQHGLNEVAYVQAILQKCVDLSIRALAITDHNSVAGVERFRELGTSKGIHVFPGFEIESKEGVQLLCLYPTDTTTERLTSNLGELGIHQVAQLSNRAFSEILKCVSDHGGVTIAAHVTSDKGLFKALAGTARANAWKDERLLAVQIPGPVGDVPEELKKIFRNQDPAYQREHAAADKLAIAAVNAKDVAKPDDLTDPAATCWIKMSEISVDGLKQAFLDPSSRIRLSSDDPPDEHAELVALAWQGGFLDGAALHFNENLNVLIGGRGSGKSTVVESLRFALGLTPLGDEAQRAHQGILKSVLRSATTVSLLVRSHSPAKREYLIERTLPNPPVVRDADGQIVAVSPRDLLPGVEIYGQHEISELAKSKEKLTALLTRFVDPDPDLAPQKLEIRRELERSRLRSSEVRQELSQIADRLGTLPGLEETLKRFKEAGLEDKLKDQTLLVREERVVKTATERLGPFKDTVDRLQRNLPIDRAFLAQKALEDLPGKASLGKADELLTGLEREMTSLAKRATEAIAKAEGGLSSVRDELKVRQADVAAAQQKILRDLQRSKIDGEEFIRLRRQIEELRPLRERQSVLKREQGEQESHRRGLLHEWEEIKARETRALEKGARSVSKRLQGRARVSVRNQGDRQPLEEVLREGVKGHIAELLAALDGHADLSLPELAEACRAGSGALVQRFSFPETQAARMAEAPPDLSMKIEELDLPATTTIELNVAAEEQQAEYKKLDDLSSGQKATAVLLLLLLESKAPLVVDQPEDDLDNRFITDGIVPRMRDEKRRRQFVFATHNANIPVLGDAELIAGLRATGDHGEIPPGSTGSIDFRPVRELVEELLEGGKDAFEMRRRKYGF